MNATIGTSDVVHASAWLDTIMVTPPPSGFQGDWLPRVGGEVPFGQLSSRFLYDELHPAWYPHQTRAGFRDYCRGAVVASVFAVALHPQAREVALGLVDARNEKDYWPPTILAPEIYVYGEDAAPCWTPAMEHLDFFLSNFPADRLVPIFNVANAPHLADKGYRAFSHNPGLVSYGWSLLLNRMREAGVFSAAIWGANYRPVYWPAGVKSQAVDAWDRELGIAFR